MSSKNSKEAFERDFFGWQSELVEMSFLLLLIVFIICRVVKAILLDQLAELCVRLLQCHLLAQPVSPVGQLGLTRIDVTLIHRADSLQLAVKHDVHY